jgi:hypothetical protein
MLAVIPTALIYRFVPGSDPTGPLRVLVMGPIVEEAVKFALFAATVFRLGYPNLIEPLDYAIFFGILGVGFGIYEDFWYIFGGTYSSWISGDAGHFREVFRWAAYARSFPGHVLFDALAGFLIGWGACRIRGWKRWIWYAGAFGTAVASHSLFNLAGSQKGTLLLWTVVVLYVGVFLAMRRRVLDASPFAALQKLLRNEKLSWTFSITPVQALFAEGFAWPGRPRRQLLAFYPLTLSLIILFPVMVSCVYFLHRLLSIGLTR